MTALFSRTDQSILGRWWWTVDRGLLAAFLALAVFGVVMVATASPPVAERIGIDQFHFIKRHLMILGPAIGVMLGVSLLSPRMLWRLCSLGLIGCFFALIAVLVWGQEIKGAQRWIDLPLMSLQPSEFVKPAFAIAAAWLIAREKDQPGFPGTKIAFGIFCVMALLIIMQPDFGMTVVLSSIFAAQLLLAGLPWLWIGGIAGLGAVGVLAAYFLLPHVRSRFDRFFDPQSGDNFQVERAVEAFQSGGLFGAGPGQGTVKLALPDAHADFIFAVAGEELGLWMTAVLIILFGFIVLRGFNRVMDSHNLFALLAVGGILTMIGLQGLIHMGASTGMLPPKGMTLPFISYGGSSMLAIAFSLGAVLSLTRQQRQTGIARGSRIRRRIHQYQGRSYE